MCLGNLKTLCNSVKVKCDDLSWSKILCLGNLKSFCNSEKVKCTDLMLFYVFMCGGGAVSTRSIFGKE